MKDVNIVSFADEKKPFMTANNITNLVKHLEDYASSIFKWFANNQMQGNATKCHILLSTNEKLLTKVERAEIENSQSEKVSPSRYLPFQS